jgi:hypothetical protein
MNLKEAVKPLSYIETNAAAMMDALDALGMMKLIQISEKAIQSGDVFDNETVFADARKRVAGSGVYCPF